METKTLDARGMSCPLPVLRANKLLKTMRAGDQLTVLATDAAAPKDFENYCGQTGHRLVDSREDEPGVYTLVLAKAD